MPQDIRQNASVLVVIHFDGGVDSANDRDLTGFFTNATRRLLVEEAANDWAYFFAGMNLDLVTAIRSVRAEMNIPASTPIPVTLAAASAETKGRAGRWAEFASIGIRAGRQCSDRPWLHSKRRLKFRPGLHSKQWLCLRH